MSRIVLALLFFCCSYSAQAELSFELLSKLTDSPQSLQGQFQQQKHIKQFDVSIHSSGEFRYERHQFIRWQTLEPIANELVMTPTRITSHQQGQELLNIDAEQQPTVKVLSQIFFAVLTAEWESLADFFYANGQEDGQHWQVELTPRTALLKQSLLRVTLQGDQLLREVTLYEQNGDSTRISFTDLVEQGPL